MKSLLFVLIGLAMFLLGGSTATATTTTKGFADTYLFEDFDVGLSPVVTTNATVNSVSNQFDFAAFIVTDYPEASSKARLCGDYTNISNPVPVAILNSESTANALRAGRLCRATESLKSKISTTDSTKYGSLSSSAYWHGGDSKASRCDQVGLN